MPGAGRVGPYEILETLGSGGMGTVYLARDVRLDRRVALKFIRADSASHAGAQPQLLDEARAASVLNHPNVCQVYDVGGEGRDSWIAMEYVDGATLASEIRAKGRLPVPRVLRLGREIADALAHAHERCILHRDLKTANIVCDHDGRPKILDFGIARRLVQDVAQEVTRTAAASDTPAIEGTLPYMAPEVIRGEPQDERSDLWSLGVVLYEMATGRLPFHGRNGFDLAAAIVHSPAPELPADVPAPLGRIVARLLSKEPTGRYATAAETAAALDALTDSRPAPPVRAPAMWVWLGAAAVVLVAFGLVAVWRLSRPTLALADQRLISTLASSHRSPSYSPDGQLLAYVGPDAAGVQQIWVRDLQQGSSLQITTGRANAGRPRWLATSNQILFALAGQGIWTVSPVGGVPKQLIERGTNPNIARGASRIVFESDRAIWTTAPDGSDLRRVEGTAPLFYALPMAPALSPDGSTIAYFHAELGPNGDFWTIPSAGGTPRRLTSDLREGGWPVWTPDGGNIVVSSARAGSRTLWQLPADGGEPLPLTTGAGEDDQPDISTDGGQLAYTNVRNTWELKIRDLTSGEDRSLLQRGLELLFPMFSPDGRRVAFFGRSDYAVAIFTIGVDGSDLRQLTGGRELNHQPRWGHDGREVFFFQNQPTVSFRRISALGGPSAEFRRWEWQTQFAPYFDPTGRYLAYLRQRPLGAPASVAEHTVLHEIATGSERAWPGSPMTPGGWSPDGSAIVGWQRDRQGARMVTVCQVADLRCRTVTRGEAAKWSPRDGRLYFTRPAAAGAGHDLWSIAPDGTRETRLTHLGNFRSIDLFFDVSRTNQIVWAPLRAGEHQLWTAQVK